jgi:hypothetical protein
MSKMNPTTKLQLLFALLTIATTGNSFASAATHRIPTAIQTQEGVSQIRGGINNVNLLVQRQRRTAPMRKYILCCSSLCFLFCHERFLLTSDSFFNIIHSAM